MYPSASQLPRVRYSSESLLPQRFLIAYYLPSAIAMVVAAARARWRPPAAFRRPTVSSLSLHSEAGGELAGSHAGDGVKVVGEVRLVGIPEVGRHPGEIPPALAQPLGGFV